jgi:precorrin-2 dehydrogenase/sirohydrochlorin ferrochelatase
VNGAAAETSGPGAALDAGFPIVLRGATLRALVVGGGAVAERKARALLDGGASVRVVAPSIGDELRRLGAAKRRLVLVEREYAAGDVADALLVVAATDVREVNARVAADALAAGRLVNVADRPEEGNAVTAATHRAGDVLVAVTAGGVPSAAVRLRDAIAARVDGRYARAIDALARLRRRLLRERGTEAWRDAAAALIGDDFCDAVERGALEERVRQWT